MEKSQIANMAEIQQKEENKWIIAEGLDEIYAGLWQGRYNRKYNPEDYGFTPQPNKLDGKHWEDPLVRDLLNNYDWENYDKFMDKLNKEHPELVQLFNEELTSYVSASMKNFGEWKEEGK